MTSSHQNTYHFLFSPFPGWGHTRAFCILAARIVKEHDNLIFTLLLSPNCLQKVQNEISAEFGNEMPHDAQHRLRVLSPCQSDSDNFLELIPLMIESYTISYQTLSQEKPITCAMTGKVFDVVNAPDVVFLDVYNSPQMLTTRAITGHKVPIIASIPLHASSVLRLYGPEHLGGNGDLGAKIEAEATRLGVTAEEIGDKLFYRKEGEVIKVPGLPDMYDWEDLPQVPPDVFRSGVSEVVKLAYRGLIECNAIFSLTSYDLEPVSVDALKICWPFEFDQPLAAAHISENLRAGFELVEVRTGEHGLKPLLRNGRKPKGTREVVGVEIREVLDACRGEKGSEMRKDAEEMAMKFRRAWEKDGVSCKNYNNFMEKYGIDLS